MSSIQSNVPKLQINDKQSRVRENRWQVDHLNQDYLPQCLNNAECTLERRHWLRKFVAKSPDSVDSPLTHILRGLSDDFADQWQGALFALNPQNPDAARHFCTSAREIINGILIQNAPNDVLRRSSFAYERTQQGTPTRLSRIRFMLHLNGMTSDELESYIEPDMKNIIQLFEIFNQGTHGTVGQFSTLQLQDIRQRVENGILYLAKLVIGNKVHSN